MNPVERRLFHTFTAQADIAATLLTGIHKELRTTPWDAITVAADKAAIAAGGLGWELEKELGTPRSSPPQPEDGPPCGEDLTCQRAGGCHRCQPRTARAMNRIAELMQWWGVSPLVWEQVADTIMEALRTPAHPAPTQEVPCPER